MYISILHALHTTIKSSCVRVINLIYSEDTIVYYIVPSNKGLYLRITDLIGISCNVVRIVSQHNI